MGHVEDGSRETTPLLASQSPQEFRVFLSSISRFSKRTYAASSQNLVKIISGVSGSQCVTEDEFEAIYTISACDSVIHLTKGYLGIGILVLPLALSYGGLVGGVLGLTLITALSIHCTNMLSSASQKLIVINDLLFIDYADTAEISFIEAGGNWAKSSDIVRHILNSFRFLSQVGNNAVYISFVAQNMMLMVEVNLSPGWSYRDYLLLLVIPTIIICSVRQLKYIAPLTIIANILQIGGLAIMFYYILSSPLHDGAPPQLFGQSSSLPLCFGIMFFAFGGISVVLPIQNQMTNPKKMLGMFGSLSISISSCGILLLAMGVLGYLKYGSQTLASITFNLPREDPLAQSCQVMFMLAVFLSYALQYYVVMEIAGPNLIEPFVSRPFYLFAEYLFRSVLNILIIGLAALVPWLDLLITLVSCLTVVPIIIIIPAIIDTAVNWETDSRTMFSLRSLKNVAIFLIGSSVMVMGTYVSVVDIGRRAPASLI